MAKIDYSVTVHNEFENQTVNVSGQSTGNVIDETVMDNAVRAFAETLVAGNSSYPLTLDSVRKLTTTVNETTL